MSDEENLIFTCNTGLLFSNSNNFYLPVLNSLLNECNKCQEIKEPGLYEIKLSVYRLKSYDIDISITPPQLKSCELENPEENIGGALW